MVMILLIYSLAIQTMDRMALLGLDVSAMVGLGARHQNQAG
jgi:hypothetical protein